MTPPTRTNIFFAVIILILAVALLYTCKHQKTLPSHNSDKKSLDSLSSVLKQKDIQFTDSLYALTNEKNNLTDTVEQLKKERIALNTESDIYRNRARMYLTLLTDAMKNKDTVGFVIGCDSLADEFEKYILSTARQDTNCTNLIDGQNKIIKSQDAAINLISTSRNDYKNAFDISKNKFDSLYSDYKKAIKPKRFGIGLQSGIGIVNGKPQLYFGAGISWNVLKF